MRITEDADVSSPFSPAGRQRITRPLCAPAAAGEPGEGTHSQPSGESSLDDAEPPSQPLSQRMWPLDEGVAISTDGGTIFLDEIGELIPELQPKLLHVLETRSFRRLGGTQEIRVDVRVIAATNKDLEAEVRAGRFREDLFYRLSVFPLQIPPLRERSADDVLELAHRLLGDVRKRNPRAPAHFSPAALELLTSHPWPGNVRELRNALQRAVVLAGDGTELRPEHFPALRGGASEIPRVGDAVVLPLAELERQHIERALFLLDGNRTHTAQRLGISRATLHAKIKQHRLEEVGRG